MARSGSPKMPTKKQIEEAVDEVTARFPLARIKALGPDGVIFEYPDNVADDQWRDKPFGGDTS